MATNNKDKKRTMLTIYEEYEADLLELKKEKFFNTSQTAMLNYLIGLGLETHKKMQKTNAG